MKSFLLLLADLLILAASVLSPAEALAGPCPVGPAAVRAAATARVFPAAAGTALRMSDGAASDDEGQDYSPQMSGLFGNVRVPAAVLAGASAGAAFSLPLGDHDGLQIGLVKRIYSLLMLTALSNQLLAIVVSTLTIGSIAAASRPKKAADMASFVRKYFDFTWTTVRFNFLSGIFFFVIGNGLRAWVNIRCAVYSRLAAGVITSSTLLAVAFIDEEARDSGTRVGVFAIMTKYIRLLFGKAKGDLIFALALICSTVTWGYAAWKLPYIANSLTS